MEAFAINPKASTAVVAAPVPYRPACVTNSRRVIVPMGNIKRAPGRDANTNPRAAFDVPGPRRMVEAMQWYLASLAMLFVMAGIGVLAGALVLAPLPARMQPGARVFLALPLGWALLTLVATLPGWVGHGYGRCHCTAVTLLLAAAGAWIGRHWLRRAGGDCARLGAFCVVASFPILGPLMHHGSFSLYNDTFIYICQAQWLQHHAFAATPHVEGGHPAWGEVISFQMSNLRMGASFLLGWVQAVFGLQWSCDAYPAVAALGLICGALGVGATLLAACPGRWVEAWLAALAVAGTVNGFAFGAADGFLPQTWGLAFAAAAFGLRGLETGTDAPRAGRGPWRTGVPLGVCVAASMHCYWDLLPLEGPALVMTYLLPWPGRDRQAWREAWRWARIPALTAVLLVNLEWIRAVKGIIQNVSAVVASPVAWPVRDFPMHALGLKSSVWELGRWITRDPSGAQLAAGCAAAAVWLAVMAGTLDPARWRHWLRPPRRLARWRGGALVPTLTWIGLSAGLFVYFRYFVRSPWRDHPSLAWPDGVGQSWSQYKVTIWGSFAVIGLVAALSTGWTMRTGSLWRRGLVLGLLLAWCGTGLGWNDLIVQRRGRWLLGVAGLPENALTACLAMRQMVSKLPPNDWIYLDWQRGDALDKYRQLLVYFLNDHPLASDWSDDGYLSPYVPPRGRTAHRGGLRVDHQIPAAPPPDRQPTVPCRPSAG